MSTLSDLTTFRKAAKENGIVLRDYLLYLVYQNTSAPAGNFWEQGGNSFGATGVLGTLDNFNLDFITGGAVKASIKQSNGYFGIGVTNPLYPFHVYSTLDSGDTAYIQTNQSQAGLVIKAQQYPVLSFLSNATQVGQFAGTPSAFLMRYNTEYAVQRFTGNIISKADNSNNWYFANPNPDTFAATARMTIQGENDSAGTYAQNWYSALSTLLGFVDNIGNSYFLGKMGIGITAPKSKLQVANSTSGLLVGTTSAGAFADCAAFGLGVTYGVIGFKEGQDVGSTAQWLWRMAENGGAGIFQLWKSGTRYAELTAGSGNISRFFTLTDAADDAFSIAADTGYLRNKQLAVFGSTTISTSTVKIDGSTAMKPLSINAGLSAGAQTWIFSTGGADVLLPAASGCSGRMYGIKNIDDSANTVQITALGGNVEGGANYDIVNLGAGIYNYAIFVSDGTDWWKISG